MRVTLLSGLGPGNSALDGVESRLEALTVLHKSGDVATSLDLAEVLH